MLKHQKHFKLFYRIFSSLLVIHFEKILITAILHNKFPHEFPASICTCLIIIVTYIIYNLVIKTDYITLILIV